LPCLIGLFTAFYPILISGFQLAQADPGDSRLTHYILEHAYQLVFNRQYPGTIFDPPFFAPYPNDLAFSENLFGTAPIYMVFRLVSNATIAYALWLMTISAGNFLSLAWVLRQYHVRRFISIPLAFTFAFGAPRLVKIAHPQLLPQLFTPIAILMLWQFLRQPSRRSWAILLGLVYWQMLSSIYLGWFMVLSLIIFTLITGAIERQSITKLWQFLQQRWRFVLSSGLLWSGLMLALLRPYWQIKAVVGDRPYAEVETMLPRWQSWFLPVIRGNLWSALLKHNAKNLPMAHEHFIFWGFAVFGLTLYCGWQLFYRPRFQRCERRLDDRLDDQLDDRKRLAQVCFLTFSAIVLITLYWPNGFSLWRWVYTAVPGATAMRAVTRINFTGITFLLISIGLSLNAVWPNRMARSTYRWIAIGVAWLMMIEQGFWSHDYHNSHLFGQAATEIAQLIRQDCTVAYFYPVAPPGINRPPTWPKPIEPFTLPWHQPTQAIPLTPEISMVWHQLTAMWAGIEANVPVVNGYSGNTPPNYPYPWIPMTSRQVLNWLDRSGLRNGQLCIVTYKDPQINQAVIDGLPATPVGETPQFQMQRILLPGPDRPGAK
jgi:hypothetical protein